MPVLANRVRVSTATTGTGTVTLGASVPGFQTFAAAGITNGQVVRYVLDDTNGNWEIGLGTYSSTGPTLTRGPTESSNSGAAINLTGGASVFLSAGKEELQFAANMDQNVATTSRPAFAGLAPTADIDFVDNVKATFGTSEDMWIYHDGGSSYIFDRGTGNLRIITNSTVSIDGASGGEFMAQFVSNGAVTLYYDNSAKIATSSTGVAVTGDIAVTGTVDGRDVATDGTKLDGIEAGADVTDTANVTAAGALMLTGGTMTGNLILNADPTVNLQAATKQYVDTIAAAGLHYHDPVRVESPTALTVTYNNGTAGVGATLTNAGTQTALVIDGVTLSVNDRVLIYVQTDATQNGVYTVTDVGSGSTNWVLTRATDADSYGASDPDALGQGDAFFVLQGDTGAGELYVMNTEGTITFGTTDITFAQVAATAVYSAGTGLTLTGTVFSTVQDISTSASPTFAGLTVTTSATLQHSSSTKLVTTSTGIDVTGDVGGDTLTISGNSTINGTLTGLSGGTGQTGAGNTQTFRVGSGGIAVGGDSYFANSVGVVTNISAGGTVTATAFSGNGASVTNVNAATLGGDSKATILATADANALALAIALG